MIFDFNDLYTIKWSQQNEKSESFLVAFKDHFQFIRGYHCSKIFNDNDFHQGLFPGNEKIIKDKARYIFRNDSRFNEISLIIDEHHISELGELHFFVAKQAIKIAYHYCLFGSEELVRIANKIDSLLIGVNARRKIIDLGKPVILHINVPISVVDDNEILIIQEIIQENDIESISNNDFIEQSLLINTKIEYKEIVKIEFIDQKELISKAIVDGMIE